MMDDSHSDALVFFGATGDLAYKKIFPSLQTLVKRGRLNVPVIGVAKAGWTLEQLRALENGYRIRVVETDYESLGVDTPDDLDRVNALFCQTGAVPAD